VTLLLPNAAGRYAPACDPDPATLGLRVPALPGSLAALEGVRWPVAQTSANASGGRDPRVLADVPEHIRDAADLVLDGGELRGMPSTVVDLRGYETGGSWTIVRQGAVAAAEIAGALG
jgi:L-threonylcarbamoyladenylate synthase